MSALLIQLPDSKRSHIGLMLGGRFAPAYGINVPLTAINRLAAEESR